ncbi:hypothetical protein BC952_2629 [Flavobacterium limicola]|uniref:Uncharacterized protein n=1 Tax=Flavobacterium limicola TaxID=180441 RepID=A0A495RYS6_9FLAO|nr:hypothetical protein [Flavobacterium limicola]RKS92713.1 hypothetical protein BC952_2629 [Flavobacterium limicola]
MNVHQLIVLLAAFSYFNLGIVYSYKFLNPEGHHSPTEQYQAEAKTMHNITLKPEMKMEKHVTNTETVAGNLKPATITTAKSTVEVHT